jgi:hypothetical protein
MAIFYLLGPPALAFLGESVVPSPQEMKLEAGGSQRPCGMSGAKPSGGCGRPSSQPAPTPFAGLRLLKVVELVLELPGKGKRARASGGQFFTHSSLL